LFLTVERFLYLKNKMHNSERMSNKESEEELHVLRRKFENGSIELHYNDDGYVKVVRIKYEDNKIELKIDADASDSVKIYYATQDGKEQIKISYSYNDCYSEDPWFFQHIRNYIGYHSLGELAKHVAYYVLYNLKVIYDNFDKDLSNSFKNGTTDDEFISFSEKLMDIEEELIYGK
jgi:hypothetical protein